MLSGISQMEKDKTMWPLLYMECIFFLKKSKKTKLIDTETRLMIVKGGGQGFEING